MNSEEFDKFADEYYNIHNENLRISGEAPEFFAAYKIRDVEAIFKHIGVKDLRILDFGAGVGSSVPHFSKAFTGSHITCLDVSAKSIKAGHKRYKHLSSFVHFGGKVIPFQDRSFDLAFTACVFHHIDQAHHSSLIEELYRVLKYGGMVFIFEHNPMNPFTTYTVNRCPFDENAVLINPRKLHNLIKVSGFNKTLLRYRIFFPSFLRFFRPAEKYLTWLPLGAQYFVAGRKLKYRS